MKAPPRLLDDPSVPERLRQPLSAAAAVDPGFDVAAGLARFEASLAALTVPERGDGHGDGDGDGDGQHASRHAPEPLAQVTPSPSKASWGARMSMTEKLALLALAGMSAVGLMIHGAHSPAHQAPRAPVENALRAPAPQDDPELQPKAVDAPDVQDPPNAPNASRAPDAGSVAVHSDPRPETRRRRSENAQMLQARELLRTDAKAALVVLQQMAREYPRGALREECDGLTVLALWQSGDATRARVLAQRFVASYPSSALRERLRPLLEEGAP